MRDLSDLMVMAFPYFPGFLRHTSPDSPVDCMVLRCERNLSHDFRPTLITNPSCVERRRSIAFVSVTSSSWLLLRQQFNFQKRQEHLGLGQPRAVPRARRPTPVRKPQNAILPVLHLVFVYGLDSESTVVGEEVSPARPICVPVSALRPLRVLK